MDNNQVRRTKVLWNKVTEIKCNFYANMGMIKDKEVKDLLRQM